MTNEVILAKISAFIDDLKEEGIEDFVFAAANSDGFMAVKYDGDPRAILYLARTLDLNIMFDSMQELVMELSQDGRKDHSE
ncbi:MAG: hypothetical protein CMB45_05405 [Euryarchaeota archaeon]|nr:hypothetical protein [Euryarchaeota archaeon]MBK38410.1 hypothetical protein [Euryarchaeota archaeon]